jgi:hypothetical protein
MKIKATDKLENWLQIEFEGGTTAFIMHSTTDGMQVLEYPCWLNNLYWNR